VRGTGRLGTPVFLRSRRVFVRHFDLPRIRDRLRVTIGTDAEMDRFLAELP
jgi:histidinol-phosphate aminotransferase